eukprot:1158599-Pelagomonas_calceolata.AAC.14
MLECQAVMDDQKLKEKELGCPQVEELQEMEEKHINRENVVDTDSRRCCWKREARQHVCRLVLAQGETSVRVCKDEHVTAGVRLEA